MTLQHEILAEAAKRCVGTDRFGWIENGAWVPSAPLVKPYIKNGKVQRSKFVHQRDWCYLSAKFGPRWSLRGYIFDFGSTPQWMHSLPSFDPLANCVLEATVHDTEFGMGLLELSQANEVFVESGTDAGSNKYKLDAWRTGLFLGSWKPWREYRQRGEGPYFRDGDPENDFVSFATYQRGRDYYCAMKETGSWAPSWITAR